MEAACRGARRPAARRSASSRAPTARPRTSGWTSRSPTGLGEARNALVVRAADALVAVGGGYGTLSEIALALKAGKPVVGLGAGTSRAWRAVASPEDAASAALEALT